MLDRAWCQRAGDGASGTVVAAGTLDHPSARYRVRVDDAVLAQLMGVIKSRRQEQGLPATERLPPGKKMSDRKRQWIRQHWAQFGLQQPESVHSTRSHAPC